MVKLYVRLLVKFVSVKYLTLTDIAYIGFLLGSTVFLDRSFVNRKARLPTGSTARRATRALARMAPTMEVDPDTSRRLRRTKR